MIPAPTRRSPSTAAALALVIVALLATLAAGGWSIMLSAGILGEPISYFEGVAVAFLISFYLSLRDVGRPTS